MAYIHSNESILTSIDARARKSLQAAIAFDASEISDFIDVVWAQASDYERKYLAAGHPGWRASAETA